MEAWTCERTRGQRAVDAAGRTAAFAAVARGRQGLPLLDAHGAEMPGAGAETHEDLGPEVDGADLRRLLLDALAPDTVAWGHAVQAVQPAENRRWRLDGVLEGPSLAGRTLGSGSDWMLQGADGYLRMDARIQVATDDHAVICARYFGVAEAANSRLTQALAASEPTAFEDQRIRTHWVLETGNPRYAWVNQAVFVGEGRLRPAGEGLAGFEHRVYIVD